MRRVDRRVKNIPIKTIIPNMITSGSVFCGVSSLILTAHERFIPAALLICFAVFFDVMDGRVARSLGGSSAFGEELDSLADAISFGVAPAFLIYNAYVGVESGIWGSAPRALQRYARAGRPVPGSSDTCRRPCAGLYRHRPPADNAAGRDVGDVLRRRADGELGAVLQRQETQEIECQPRQTLRTHDIYRPLLLYFERKGFSCHGGNVYNKRVGEV